MFTMVKIADVENYIWGGGTKTNNIHLKYIFITASNITVSLPQSKLALSLVHEIIF